MCLTFPAGIPAKAGIHGKAVESVLGGPRFVVAAYPFLDMTEHVPPTYSFSAASTPSTGSVFRICPAPAQPRRAMPTPKRMSGRCSVT